MNNHKPFMHGPAVLRKEPELKLTLPPMSLSALKKVPLLRAAKITSEPVTEVSVYFDTDERKLAKHGLILRVCQVGDRYVQIIESAKETGTFGLDEWRTEIAGEEPDLNLAISTALAPLLNKKLRRQLVPLFKTRMQRTAYAIKGAKRNIVLTIDRGSIVANRRSVPLCEIELELRHGSVVELFKVARELMQTLPAQLIVKSKAERGYELIDSVQEEPVKAASIDLPVSVNARNAFKMIGMACLEQIISNEPAIIKGHPEGVHQMRVGLRRLRAGMSSFSRLLRDPETTAIKNELKWLAGALGPARELEVLVNRVVAPVNKAHPHWDGVPSLSRQIARKRRAAITRAQGAVRSTRFRVLTLETAAWLQTGKWTSPQDDLVRDWGDRPIVVFAAKQLTRRWSKLRTKRKPLAELDAPSRHKLRIETKKFRYAVEFFASLFASKRATKRRKQLLPALESLQDGLGELNDIVVDEQRIAALGLRGRAGPKRAFAAGVFTGREDARIEAAIEVAAKAYDRLLGIKPFWR